MFNNKKTIEFISINEYYASVVEDMPSPSTKFVPSWWKKMDSYVGGKIKIQGSFSSATGKKCMPMLDAITSGYTVPLWSDILVTKTGVDSHSVSWRTDEAVLSVHDPRQSEGVAVPYGYSTVAYKYNNPWVVKTPPGWSCLITHPVGHYDLPFRMINAIVDTDVYPQDFNPVFWFKEDFEGIIERGTPMYQIIPIKREKWQSKISKLEDPIHYYNQQKNIGRTILNNYVKNIWNKKEYK